MEPPVQNVFCKGKALYSRYAPSASAERAAARAPLKEECIYFVPSPLLAYGLPRLLKTIPSSSMILAVELEAELPMSCAPESPEPGRFQGFRLKDGSPAELYKIFTSLQQGQFRNCLLYPLNGGYTLNKRRYDALFTALQHFMKNYWHNRLTMSQMGFLWIKNICSTMGKWKQSLSSFKTEKPVFIAGAGESLEESFPLIKEFRNSLYILAVDTACQSLVRSKIVPDGVVNLESQFYNLKDFYALAGREVDLFSDITAYPASLDFPGHRHYFFASSFEDTALHRRMKKANILPEEIPPLGSVGVTALYLAAEMTKAPIFLSGLDFGYTRGKTHVKESPFHDWFHLKENRLTGDLWYNFTMERPSEKVHGKEGFIHTNNLMRGYARQLESLCAGMTRPVHDLGNRGLTLNIPKADRPRFMEILKAWFSRKQCSLPPAPLHGEINTQAVSSFIRSEIQRLEKLIACWDKLSLENKGEEELLNHLRDCNYLYFHYPDRSTLPDTSPAFLFRAIHDARKILNYLKRNVE